MTQNPMAMRHCETPIKIIKQAEMTLKICTFAKKTRGSVAHLKINVSYLLARLASKDGKTDIGDTLVKKSHSRLVAYRLFSLFYPLSHEFSKNF